MSKVSFSSTIDVEGDRARNQAKRDKADKAQKTVTFGSKVAQKATVTKPKSINYERHTDGRLSLNKIMLTTEEQVIVEKKLVEQGVKG